MVWPWGSKKEPGCEDAADADPAKKPKGINLSDPYAIKRNLDDVASEIVLTRGYTEDVTLSNWKMLLGLTACAIALVAQFYPKKFPENKPVLIACIVSYILLNAILQYIAFAKEKNHILFTNPFQGSVMQPGLAVSSKMPRYSDLYTLTIASRNPNSKAAKDPVELTKSVTKWYTSEGILVENLFWGDVQKLLETYEKSEVRKKK
eukprot:TRINITY_DN23000_c0_g1_i1.p1 TRINITY_DN23000_c0_g1~~TRINITY_DN23000_c0_g1_i1.p1  ORF type:complete len:205 (-),score=45.24 TRINITY_DN23000_c0_g1_i1:346-960(-)